MGIGKTLQMIALILSNRKPRDEKEYCKTTLIVLPVSLIDQWRLEIENKTYEGSLSVYVYHGPKRNTDKNVLKKVRTLQVSSFISV
jgi:SNF2 family DNA or RNA helicase